MKLKDKVAVVTGGSMGIGEAIALEFARKSASVVVTSRELARAEAARVRIGHVERTLAVACDVRERSDLEDLLRTTLQRFGRVDIWVNNAGHGLIDSVAQMSIADCRAMFDTNLFGAIEGMQVITPVMTRQRAGTIINMSSVAGHIAVPYMAAYCATKHALNAIGKAARVELRGTGVHVMTVCPGYISTDFAANAVKGREPKRIAASVRYSITADRVARAVVRGYLKQSREIVVPWQDRIIIKLYQNFPTLLELGMGRALRPAHEVIAAAQAAKKH
jgi:short-subunit dehydrogenase